MHPAAIAGKMILRVLAFPIAREAIPGRRRGISAPGTVVTGIGPEPRRLGLAGAGGEQADGRVIRKDRLGRQDMTTDGIGQRFQQGGGLSDPIGQRRAIQIKAIPVEDLTLAIEGEMVGILGSPAHAPRDPVQDGRARWGATAAGPERSAREPSAGQPGTDDAVHDEASRHVF
jgi:hypothetical protein